MRNWLIYRITNKITGKVYIGQTRQGLARRKGEHIHRFNLGERDHKLYRAMRKHGLAAFEFEILCHALKAEYLDELERHFIREHNSFERGYNMTCGGDSVSEETRRKISAAHKGRKITWYDKIVATRRLRPGKSPKDFVPKGDANVNAKSYLIRFPDGSEKIIKGLNQFCLAQGLTKKGLFDVLEGKQRHHKGFALLARFNDYPEREYSQVAGNGARPAALAG